MLAHAIRHEIPQLTCLVLNDVVKQLLRILSRHRGVNDDIFALLPVNGSRHLMFIGELESCKKASHSGVSYSCRLTGRTVNNATVGE